MSEEINFSVAERFSYAYVDGKYAKITAIASGDAVLADPTKWSYAETHSYVKVDKDSLGISLPAGFTDDVYAKVVYISNAEIDPIFNAVSGQFAKASVVNQALLKKQDIITVSSKLDYSFLSGETDFLTKADYSVQSGQFAKTSDIPLSTSQLVNDSNFATTSYVSDQVNSLVNGAGETLDTLKELADALSGDANFAETMIDKLNQKQDAIIASNKLDYSLVSGGLSAGANITISDNAISLASSIYISGSEDYNTFKLNESNLSLGTLDNISSPTGNLLQINIGIHNETSGLLAYAHGKNAKALEKYSVADGHSVEAAGWASHAEGGATTVKSEYSHAEGQGTLVDGDPNVAYASHAEGFYTKTFSKYAHAEGYQTVVSGEAAHAEGYNTKANGAGSHAEGSNTTTMNTAAHAEGYGTNASGEFAHAEGYYSHAIGKRSHAEGVNSITNNEGSHAEGFEGKTFGKYAHAEGYQTVVSGEAAHAEGYNTEARKSYSHAEGYQTIVSGDVGHAEGRGTIAGGKPSLPQHVEGKYNIIDTKNKYQHIVGGGSSDNDRKNIQTLDWNGNEWNAGSVSADSGFYVNGKQVATQEWVEDKKYATSAYVDDRISEIIGGAPEILDTLKEISDSLSGDANFASTIINELSLKANGSDIPTKVSDLTNDTGFITDYTETDPVYIADKPTLALKSDITGFINSDYLTNNNYVTKSDINTSSSESTTFEVFPNKIQIPNGSVSSFTPEMQEMLSSVYGEDILTEKIGEAIPSGMTEKFYVYSVTSSNLDSDVVVDWGDGTSSSIADGEYEAVSGNVNNGVYYTMSHTYSVSGDYSSKTFLVTVKGSEYHSLRHCYTSGHVDFPCNLVCKVFGKYRSIASHLTNCSSMFFGSKRLLFIDANYKYSLTNVTNCASMFNFCKNLIRVENLEAPEYGTMGSMFRDCTSLKSSSVGIWNTRYNASKQVLGTEWRKIRNFGETYTGWESGMKVTAGNIYTYNSNYYLNITGTNTGAPDTDPGKWVLLTNLGKEYTEWSYTLDVTAGTIYTVGSDKYVSLTGKNTYISPKYEDTINYVDLANAMYMNDSNLEMDIAKLIPNRKNPNDAVYLNYTFRGCSKLSGTVPASVIWNDTTTRWNIVSPFYGCSNEILNQIPSRDGWGGKLDYYPPRYIGTGIDSAIERKILWKADRHKYGDDYISVGRKENTDVGKYSIAFGANSEALSNYSVAVGSDARSSGGSSFALGAGTYASSWQFVVGKYNKTDSDSIFIVGNGTNAAKRSNALTLSRENGNLWVAGDVVAGSHTLSEKANTSDIPSALSQLTNDSGYITGYTETDPIYSAQSGQFALKSDIKTPYDLATVNEENNFFGQDSINISALIKMNPIIVLTTDADSDQVSIPTEIQQDTTITENHILTKEIWIGVPKDKTVTFDSSSLSSYYDLIGDFPSTTLSGSTTKEYAYYIFVMRCNTKGTVNAELAFSHIFNTNGVIE